MIEPEQDNSLGMQQTQLDLAYGLLEIAQKKWAIPEQEIHYLYKYLISSDIGPKKSKKNGAGKTQSFDLARTVAQEMSGCILKALRITVDDDSELMNGLLRQDNIIRFRRRVEINRNDIPRAVLSVNAGNFRHRSLPGLRNIAAPVCRPYGKRKERSQNRGCPRFIHVRHLSSVRLKE